MAGEEKLQQTIYAGHREAQRDTLTAFDMRILAMASLLACGRAGLKLMLPFCSAKMGTVTMTCLALSL